MALQKSTTWAGLTAPNSYSRIHRIYGGKTEGWNCVVHVFADAATAVAGERMTEFGFSTPYDAKVPNPFVALYTALAASPDYTGATSV